MKYPYIQFYVGDWLSDTELSLCSPATRGVWIDLLCRMHALGREGELRGTSNELAQLARCLPAQLEAALTEIQTKDAGRIEQRNGSWTVANRRMAREADLHRKRAVAGSIGGSKAQANTVAKVKQVSDSGLCISDDLGKDGDTKGKKNRCTEEEATDFFKTLALPATDAAWFYWKCEANGWTNGGKPIRDWRATIRSWKSAGYLPSQKSNGMGQIHKLATSSKPAPGSWLSMPDPRPDDDLAHSMEVGRKRRALNGEE